MFYVNLHIRESLVVTSESDNRARARLIKTRRGTWIDESLLPEARRECLEILREASRKAVGEDAYIPGWISDICESAHDKAQDISSERLTPERTPTQERSEEEADAIIEALNSRGAFEGLSIGEYWDFLLYIMESVDSKYAAQVAREVEEVASRRKPIPKSNPTLITEKELLDLVLDVLHSRGVLDSIIELDLVSGAAIEEWKAGELAREARATARWCGSCGRELPSQEAAYFGAEVYVGMRPLDWNRVSKPRICQPLYERTVLCGSCAPEWLSPDRDDVVTQLCAQCERPMVSRLKLSSLRRTFCSDSCQQAYRNLLRKEERAEERKKVCEVCGEEFAATRRDTKTCSPACKQKAYRQRKKEAQQNR
jgi:thymidine kinase